ncbi:ArsA family ATPase [Microaerobacter geothermalis]|uniref:ArsA family ATPase n=1 Tax=Microaerobacter geothermalis TaxID=674972 RepID=UPI001F2F2231|nr:ArsA family ATPase [Microaerobacter geothermalis]MCF6095278.1 ArsA family ATPase [Microaerobacter geothermalis]
MIQHLKKRILFFGGKGGVGKTTSASAFALLASKKGKKTLLVSTDPAHNTGDIFGKKIGHEVTEAAPLLYALEIDPHRETHRYIQQVKENLREIVHPKMMDEIHRQIDITSVSPGADEAALFDRMVDIIREGIHEYDLIVFDTAPTGHTIRLLSLPELMGVWIDSMISRREKVNELHRMWLMDDQEPVDDPIYRILTQRKMRFKEAREILLDQNNTSFVFVLIPERLPIVETEKAISLLQKYKISIDSLIVNRILPEDVQDLFFQKRKKQERIYLQQIKESFLEQKIHYVPMLDHDVYGLSSLNEIANCFESQL